MRRKPRLLLLDAGAVIGAFACEGWDQLCKSYHIVVPTIVIGEARFYHDSVGNQRPIGLDHHIESGLIERFEASATELATTIALLHPYIRDRLHAGELEALTYLRLLEEKSGIGFISADGAAIQATYAFDAARCALSLAEALKRCGITKALERKYCEEFVRKHLAEGERLLVQGLLRVDY